MIINGILNGFIHGRNQSASSFSNKRGSVNVVAPETEETAAVQGDSPFRMTIHPRYVKNSLFDIKTPANGKEKRMTISSFYAPVFSKYNFEFLKNNKNAAELFCGLSKKEIDLILRSLRGTDVEGFKLLLNDGKPSLLTICKDEEVSALKKMNSKNIETVVVPSGHPDENRVFIVNKKQTKKIILDNFEFFALRLGFLTEANEDLIYDKLFHSDIAGKLGVASEKMNDVTGIILGYPKISSLIFNLETCIPRGVQRNRENIPDFKQKLTSALYGENSPYKYMGGEFISSLKAKIDSIDKIQYSKDVLKRNERAFAFIYYVDEPEEISRIEGYV